MYLNLINTEKNEKKEVKEEKTYNQKKVLNIHKDEDNSEKNNTTKNTDESVETAE